MTTTTEEDYTGSIFAARRAGLNMTRKEVADLAGVREHMVWRIEKNLSIRKNAEPEAQKYRDWLQEFEGRRAHGQRPVSKVTGIPGAVVIETWHGMMPGTKFKVRGEEGIFTFRAHVLEPKGTEYIDCYGGRLSKHLRSFRPERIVGGKITAKDIAEAEREENDDE